MQPECRGFTYFRWSLIICITIRDIDIPFHPIQFYCFVDENRRCRNSYIPLLAINLFTHIFSYRLLKPVESFLHGRIKMLTASIFTIFFAYVSFGFPQTVCLSRFRYFWKRGGPLKEATQSVDCATQVTVRGCSRVADTIHTSTGTKKPRMN